MCSSRVAKAMALVGLVLVGLTGQCYGALQFGFYNGKCKLRSSPSTSGLGILGDSTSSTSTSASATNINVEETVAAQVKIAFNDDNTIVAALLRMQFHDCFVKGCDASILLDRDDGIASEKEAPPNLSVRGYDIIDNIKKTLEGKCPGVVSCADIIVMATRDAVALASGGVVKYNVQTGRRDGTVSLATNVDLPSPKISVLDSITAFKHKGLNAIDMVYLLGGHTVGVTHCGLFQDRLYNFQNTGKPDPTMDPTLVEQLKKTCPQGSTVDNSVFLDQNPKSSMTVDKSYYNQLLINRGILQIDQALATDGLTNTTVKAIANGVDFPLKFGQAMVKLGAVQVITDPSQGQIRKLCGSVN